MEKEDDKNKKISFKKFLNKEQKERASHWVWTEDHIVPCDDPQKLKEESMVGSYENPTFHTYPVKDIFEHDSTDEMKKHIHKYAQFDKENFTDGHRATINAYKRDSEGINFLLRDHSYHHHEGYNHISDHAGSAALQQYHRLDHITSREMDHSLVVYRGIDRSLASQMKPGQLWQDHGYTGTSLFRTTAEGFSHREAHANPHFGEVIHVARIHLNPGIKGFYLNHNPDYKYYSEKEFLLHRGTRFRVLGHEVAHYNSLKYAFNTKDDYNRKNHIVHLEAVDHRPMPLK